MSVHVAVGIIINNKNKVLIAKRSAQQHQGDKWELPGGKVEDTETSEQALQRELKEELGIEIDSCSFFTEITHQYNDKKVVLDVFEVKGWKGEPKGLEGQPLLWVEKSELKNYKFPTANLEILNKLV